MSKILIAITTRNRSDLLHIALHYHTKFLPENAEIYIVDDGSKDEHFGNAIDLVAEYNDDRITLSFNGERHGIAKSKNKCLKYAKEINADYIFLFDDDAWPNKKGWEQLYIEAHKKAVMNHLTYNDIPHNRGQIHNINGVNILASDHSHTAIYFLTKEALEKVGGYNKEYGYYGFEHISYSDRMRRAGMTNGLGLYISLPEATEYIYSMDFDYVYNLKQDVDGLVKMGMFRSSIHGENRKQLDNMNREIFFKDSIGAIFQEFE